MNSEDNKEQQTVFKEGGTEAKKEQTSSGLEENLAGLLCYLAWAIGGIVFLIIEKENKFIRFHAIQSIATSVVLIILNIVLTAIPFIGWAIGLILTPLYLVLWAFMMFKAYKGEKFKLPFVGDFAEKQVNKA